MHAIGDMTDGDFGFRHAGPERLPHLPADIAVKAADAVAGGGHAQRQHGHAEFLGLVGRVAAAQSHKLGARNAQAADVIRQVAIQEAGLEVIVAGGDRCMGGEDQLRGGGFAGFGEGEAAALHDAAHAFEREERGVSLVHVIHRGGVAERVQGAIAADAEQQFLLQAHFEPPP